MNEIPKKFSETPLIEMGNSQSDIYLLIDPPIFSSPKYKSYPINKLDYSVFKDHLIETKVYNSEDDIFKEIKIGPSLSHNLKESKFGASNAKILDEDIQLMRDGVLEKIKSSNPKVIIASGNISTKIISNFEFENHQNAPTNYNIGGIPVLFFDSLRGILSYNKGEFKRKALSKLGGKILYARSLVKEGPEEASEWHTLDAARPEEVQKLFDIFLQDSKLVLDYETSGLNTYKKDFHLGGIGLCSMDTKRAVYIKFFDFFRKYSDNKDLIPQESLSGF